MSPSSDDEGLPPSNVNHKNRPKSNDEEFKSTAVDTFLGNDPRPTFALVEGREKDLNPIYLNRALLGNFHLMKALPFHNETDTLRPQHKNAALDFIAWIRIVSKSLSARSTTFPFLGFLWTGFIVENWTVISGDLPPQKVKSWNLPARTEAGLIPNSSNVDGHRDGQGEMQADLEEFPIVPQRPLDHIAPAFISTGTPDWTVEHPKGELSAHVKLVRAIDWEKTSLGAMSLWTREFRQIANHMMANPHPAALFWGDDLCVMYNEAYAKGVAGRKHPGMLGAEFHAQFYELWFMVKTIFDECRVNGRAVSVNDQHLPIDRLGFIEETFYSWSLVPLYGGTNEVLGMYNAPFDVSKSARSARAIQTLLSLGQKTSLATTVGSFWKHILDGLEENEYDFPLVILYSVSDKKAYGQSPVDVEANELSDVERLAKVCHLEGTLGVPKNHPLALEEFDFENTQDGFVPFYKEALLSRKPKVVDLTKAGFPPNLLNGITWRGFEEPCRYAVFCPLRPTTSDAVLGFLCVGVNPRRPYDHDYESFIELINRQLATSLASVTALEAEIQRGLTAAEAAALEKSRLTRELAVQQSRLQRIAEVSPVGMFSIDIDGTLLEANGRWHEITSQKVDEYNKFSWYDAFASKEAVDIAWAALTIDEIAWSGELQLIRRQYDDVSKEEIEMWVLAAASPEYEDGVLVGITGSITDITPQKRSEKDLETRARLSEQLLLRTQEAKEIEKNFKRFSDMAPGGLVIMSPAGVIDYANPQWYNISGDAPTRTSAEDSQYAWTDAISEDDQAYFALKWAELIQKKKTITVEARMRSPWEGEIAGSRVRAQRWILTSFYPEIDESGNLVSVMGCITDVSAIKWVEDLQTRRLAEAEETRRAQNSFIDITSHEMRNPLSAILQCADGITSSLMELISTLPLGSEVLTSVLQESITLAETIQLCAQHQKNIVDDILTISKLDSNLLTITPVSVEPIFLVEKAITMFSVEAHKLHSIRLNVHVNKSYRKLNVSTVMLDSSRLLQILINLMTNAIKFTKTSRERTIDIYLDAYLEAPVKPEFAYFPQHGVKTTDVTAGEEWGNGEPLYLHFAVKDTGCGLTSEEKNKLFRRFQQASPRTHIHYGGSGLGLFISRQLAELQGGEIGVASEADIGSTFAFYIRTRRCTSTPKQTSFDNGRSATKSPLASRRDAPEPTQSPRSPTGELVAKLETTALTRRTTGTVPTSTLQDWHILVVEDNLVNQRILAQQLRKLGCTVLVANDGQEALDIIEQSTAYKGKEENGKELTVVLMDLEMPIMDGLTAVRLIRHLEAEGKLTRHIPIIAVTANARGEQIAAAENSGMDSVVSKPFRVKELIPKVEDLLKRL